MEAQGTDNENREILTLLKQDKAFICNIATKEKKQISIPFPATCYSIDFDVGFTDAKKIGFGPKDIHIIENKIVFGISQEKISAYCLNTNKSVSLNGSLPCKLFYPITHSNGLLLVGGEDPNDETVPNGNIWSIHFDENKFTQTALTKMPYSTVNPSVLTLNGNGNEQLFVCGGWWDHKALSSCFLYNFENDKWMSLKNMNSALQCAGICEWKVRGNKIVAAAGYPDSKIVEEYDMAKDKWVYLPPLNNKHETYPALFPSNNILFCVGGVDKSHDNLGCVEMFDPRDNAHEWLHVDTVENYFGIENGTGGAGFNCFLPI